MEDIAEQGQPRHSYSAIAIYLQCGTYPEDADKKQKNSLRKRAKFFVMLDSKLHYSYWRLRA